MASSFEESPFKFYRTTTLLESTGKRASNLTELLEGIRSVDDLSIIFHMLTPLYKWHQGISDRTNDFSNWVAETLQEKVLSEHLTAIDPYQLNNIPLMRKQLESTIQDYLSKPKNFRNALRGDEFFFHTITRIVFPTRFIAYNLLDFGNILEMIDASSIYHHFVEPRIGIRPHQAENKLFDDFSIWIASISGTNDIINRFSQFDPFLLTLDEIRHKILSLIQ